MISAEVAIYPGKTDDSSKIINDSIGVLKDIGINHSTDSMKTHITGKKDEIFKGLNSMFTEAEKLGAEVNMVVTITNAAD